MLGRLTPHFISPVRSYVQLGFGWVSWIMFVGLGAVCVCVCGRERPFMIRLHACAGMGLRAPPLLCWVTDSQPCCCGTLCCELWRQGMALAKVVTCSNKGLLWVLCSSPGACGIPRAH